jgi:hypothetical protein
VKLFASDVGVPASANDGLDQRFAVFDDDIEVDAAVAMPLSQLALGRAQRFRKTRLTHLRGIVRLPFRFEQASMELLDARFADAGS